MGISTNPGSDEQSQESIIAGLQAQIAALEASHADLQQQLDSFAPVDLPDGVYQMGIGGNQAGTFTVQNKRIIAVTEAMS